MMIYVAEGRFRLRRLQIQTQNNIILPIIIKNPKQIIKKCNEARLKVNFGQFAIDLDCTVIILLLAKAYFTIILG